MAGRDQTLLVEHRNPFPVRAFNACASVEEDSDSSIEARVKYLLSVPSSFSPSSSSSSSSSSFFSAEH